MKNGASRGIVLGAIGALVLAALWWMWPDDRAARPPERSPGDRMAVVAEPPRLATRATPADERVATKRDDATPTAPVAVATTLRVRLRGLDAGTPWTAAVRFRIHGRDSGGGEGREQQDAAVPDASGTVAFALPAWLTTTDAARWWLEAVDENYLPLAVHAEGPPPTQGEFVLDVQLIANLRGRVVDNDAQPIAAVRVTAFTQEKGTFAARAVASGNTGADGCYHLRVPPDTRLCLIAVAMQAHGGRISSVGEDTGVADNGEPRIELLPARTETSARTGQPTSAPDIVLTPASMITGHVRWSDGAPAEIATLAVLPQSPASCTIEGQLAVHLFPNGPLALGTRRDTEPDGSFELPGPPGVVTEVRVVAVTDTTVFGGLPARLATAPQQLELVLPLPVTLRAVARDAAVAQARIELTDGERGTTRTTDKAGVLRVLAGGAFRARASHDRMLSPWVDVTPGAAGTEVRLPLADARVPVTVEFEGEFRVRNTVVTWHAADGRDGREHLLRDDRAGAFQFFLDPGHYTLTAGPGGGERNGVYLLPVTREIDVVADPVALVLPATFGGTFVVHATDERGLYVPGICRVVGPDGRECSAPFEFAQGAAGYGRDGELLAGGPNEFTRVLPPGTYELHYEFEEYGTRRDKVTIRAREVTDAHLRLP